MHLAELYCTFKGRRIMQVKSVFFTYGSANLLSPYLPYRMLTIHTSRCGAPVFVLCLAASLQLVVVNSFVVEYLCVWLAVLWSVCPLNLER